MAIPSGSGTEVLKRVYVDGLSNSPASPGVVLINGEADHIYTILSVVFCETAGSAQQVEINVKPDGSGQVRILKNGSVPASGQFVWNDKFSITGTAELCVWANGGNVDCWCTYIEQDWS